MMFLFRRIVYFLLLSFLLTGIHTSGNNAVDSLFSALRKTDDIESKIKIYLAISRKLEKKSADSALLYARLALNLAKGIKSEVPIARAYERAARIEIRQNKLDQAYTDLSMARMYYRNTGIEDDYLWTITLLGNIHLTHDDIAGAMALYLEVTNRLEATGDRGGWLLPSVYNSIGSIFMEAEDYSSALGYITKALSIFRKIDKKKDEIYPLMNLGEIYFELGNMEMSKEYIRQTIELAKQIHDRVAQSRGYMILGKILTREGKHKAAITMLDSSRAIQEEIQQGYDGPLAVQYSEMLVQMGETWRLAGNYSLAYKYCMKGLMVAKAMKQINQECKVYKQLSLIHEAEGRTDSALIYYKNYILSYDQLVKTRNVKAVRLMAIREDLAKKQKENELNMANAESSRQRLIILSIAGGAGLILVIMILMLMLKLEKQRKREAETAKNNLEEKLDFQNKELMTNVMYLTKMNELVVAIAEKLNSMGLDHDSENQKIVQSIIHELKQTTSIESWKDFEVRFQQVHVGFYKKLSEQFSDLSPNDLKMCAFLRLNLSTKEISSITHQSLDSIRMARSRLRQKLGITKDESLVTFLTQI